MGKLYLIAAPLFQFASLWPAKPYLEPQTRIIPQFCLKMPKLAESSVDRRSVSMCFRWKLAIDRAFATFSWDSELQLSPLNLKGKAKKKLTSLSVTVGVVSSHGLCLEHRNSDIKDIASGGYDSLLAGAEARHGVRATVASE